MITYEAIIEGTDISFRSTRKAEIKKWAKNELKNGAESIVIYAYHKSAAADTYGQPTFSYAGFIDNEVSTF